MKRTLKVSKKILAWRESLPKGSIMSKKTFDEIAAEARRKGYRDPQGVAGKAYYNALLAKYRAAHRRNPLVSEENPPIPATVFSEITTAKTIIREVDSGERSPRPALSRADDLLESALEKIRTSHKGHVDWENPPAVEIYRDLVEIKAVKRDGKRYVHRFGKGSEILGLPDGCLLIRSRDGKRLWKNFETGGV